MAWLCLQPPQPPQQHYNNLNDRINGKAPHFFSSFYALLTYFLATATITSQTMTTSMTGLCQLKGPNHNHNTSTNHHSHNHNDLNDRQ